jgi:sphinganine-1-phosphate aldolase
MNIKDMYQVGLKWLGPRVLQRVVELLEKIPAARRMIEGEYEELAREIQDAVKPYKDRFDTVEEIPDRGWQRDRVIEEMEELAAMESNRWKDGYVSGAVYHGDPEYVKFLGRIYDIHSQTNPLHSDLWPSVVKFESEIVAMTASMLGGGAGEKDRGTPQEVCGVVTSGGTESILLAMKAYRDWARAEKGIRRPVMVVPETAHAAFDKAAECFDIKIRHVPVNGRFEADVEATTRALSDNTIVVVGSAPCFPHGTIKELSEVARSRGIGFHTDACLGGFMLPWAERLGYPVPPFDFRLPGVTSMSADTHKYGYASKGTSVVLYRGLNLRHYQYFKTTEWPGGVYFTPTFAGSRPGALSAACWAALVANGKDGYTESARRILQTADRVKEGIRTIPGLHILGDPLWVIAFGSEELDIYEVVENMSGRGWNLNALQNPPSAHLCVTLRHCEPGVAERFVEDLGRAAEMAGSRTPGGDKKIALYGMATTFPDRRLVSKGLNLYMDILYSVDTNPEYLARKH